MLKGHISRSSDGWSESDILQGSIFISELLNQKYVIE